MNSKEFSFIIAVQGEEHIDRCTYCINNLAIPEGYTVNVYTFQDYPSMCNVYNNGIIEAKGKYKIYIHQDIYIINRNILFDLLDIFSNNEDIGMVGVAGAIKMPEVPVWWNGNNNIGIVRHYAENEEYDNVYHSEDQDFDGNLTKVEAIDGIFMATQHDIYWREDLFDGWDFYDISQSYEFRRNNLKVVVPNTIKEPWVLHNVDNSRGIQDDYFKYMDIFINEYIKTNI